MPTEILNPIDEDAVLKEVWNTDNIQAKTELTDAQISKVNRLETLGELFGSSILKGHVTNFMKLQKSRNRKSMAEFVDVVRAKREDFVNKGKSWFGSLMG